MKKVLLAALALGFGMPLAGTASAQQETYKTEVCVNASQAAEAKRRFRMLSSTSYRTIPIKVGTGGELLSVLGTNS